MTTLERIHCCYHQFSEEERDSVSHRRWFSNFQGHTLSGQVHIFWNLSQLSCLLPFALLSQPHLLKSHSAFSPFSSSASLRVCFYLFSPLGHTSRANFRGKNTLILWDPSPCRITLGFSLGIRVERVKSLAKRLFPLKRHKYDSFTKEGTVQNVESNGSGWS